MGQNRRTGRRTGDELVTEVVSVVADATGVDALDLPPLAETIDPEGAQMLLSGADATLRISFEYAGCEVSLGGDGSVDVRERGLSR